MDNQSSQPQINVPEVPADAEVAAGTSKTDLINYILDLVRKSTITGINQDPAPYDLTTIAANVEALQESVEDLESRKPRHLTMAGVNNGQVVVPFTPFSPATNNYQVDVAFVWTSGMTFPEINWAIVEDSKTTSQFALRIDGSAGTFDLEITITPLVGL